MASPDGPKSGCSRMLPAFMLAIHAPLRACTGSPLTSACHTLSAGKIEHPRAAGGGPAHAGAATPTTIASAATTLHIRMPSHRREWRRLFMGCGTYDRLRAEPVRTFPSARALTTHVTFRELSRDHPSAVGRNAVTPTS